MTPAWDLLGGTVGIKYPRNIAPAGGGRSLRHASFFVSLVIVALAALAAAPHTAAQDYNVSTNPYNQNHTLSSTDLWDAYEFVADNGQSIAYSVTVSTPGGCAQVFFVKGHNANLQSLFYERYSQTSCVASYANTFPVGSSDGREFTLLISSSSSSDVAYTVSLNTTSPILPTWVLGLVVFIVIGAVAGGIGALIRKRLRAAAMPPIAPPMGPPPYPQAPPMYPPEQPPGPPPMPP